MRNILVDGVSLRQRENGFWLTKQTSIPASADWRVAVVTAPFMDGAIPVAGGYGTGRVSVELVVRGGFDELHSKVSRVQALLAGARGLTLIEGADPLTVGVVQARVADPVWSTEKSVKLSCVFEVQPFWRGKQVTANGVLVFGTTYRLDGLDGTGDLDTAIVRVTGAGKPVAVTGTDGTGASSNDPVPAGSYWYLDVANWLAWVSTNAAQWTPLVSAYSPDFPPAGQLRLAPVTTENLAAQYEIQANGAVTVRAKESWL